MRQVPVQTDHARPVNDRLRARLAARGGVLTHDDATNLDLSSRQLGELVRRGTLLRVRRGAFVDGQLYESSDPSERYRLAVLAILLSRPGDAASHHAALAVHRLPTFGVDWNRIDLVGQVSRVKTAAPLVVHPGDGGRNVQVDGVRCQPIARALVRTAVASGLIAGLVPADAALANRSCTRADLQSELAALGGCRGSRYAASMIELADERSESPGETRTRLLLLSAGLPVRTQVPILQVGGGVLARVDFLVGGRVIVEFDGAVKYRTGDGAVLFQEKQREDRLRDLGYEVVRVIWPERDQPGEVIGRVRAALARTRTIHSAG
jgi:very-short-patch-repair endonuclease